MSPVILINRQATKRHYATMMGRMGVHVSARFLCSTGEGYSKDEYTRLRSTHTKKPWADIPMCQRCLKMHANTQARVSP